MAAPITDLPSLTAAVLDYLDRPEFADVVPGLVALAESRFNAGLRAREMEAATAPADGVAQVALPADFLEWIAVEWTGTGRTRRPTFAESNSPEARYKHRPNGDPQYFTVLTGRVRMVPEKVGRIALFYYAAVPSLTMQAPANWLIAKAPDAYLYAVLAEAYLYDKAPEIAQAHLGLAVQSLTALGMKADTAKIARRPARQAELEASAQASVRPE